MMSGQTQKGAFTPFAAERRALGSNSVGFSERCRCAQVTCLRRVAWSGHTREKEWACQYLEVPAKRSNLFVLPERRSAKHMDGESSYSPLWDRYLSHQEDARC